MTRNLATLALAAGVLSFVSSGAAQTPMPDCSAKFQCADLAYKYIRGIGVPKDEAVARLLYKRSCEAGNGGACFDLAVMWERGVGGPFDIDQAREAFLRSCDLAVPAACWDAALMYRDGKGTPKDEARARDLYQKSCDAGRGEACALLAGMYEAGDGFAVDAALARKLYQQACDEHVEGACESVARLQAAGVPDTRPVDPERAAALAAVNKVYAPYLGRRGRAHVEELARTYTPDPVPSTVVELNASGARYRLQTVSWKQIDDCEACSGHLDLLVSRDGKPAFLSAQPDDGSHGIPHDLVSEGVIDISRGEQGFVSSRESWLPHGCGYYAFDFYWLDLPHRRLASAKAASYESCDVGDTARVVPAFQWKDLGLDAMGRGQIQVELTYAAGRKAERTTRRTLARFDPVRRVMDFVPPLPKELDARAH